MKLSFHGGARTVTGTKHLLTLNNGTKLLFDCGLFQGLGSATDDLNAAFGFEPSEISYLLLSHAHIDHSGLIPKLVKEGFTGTIYCTAATMELAEVLLYDSAEIQTYETEQVNKKRAASNLEPYEVLYTPDDVAESLKLFQTVSYDEAFSPDEHISVVFTNTGHLVGCAAIHVTVKEEGETTRVTFSGDVGRFRSVLLQPPAPFPQADYVILESTYGNKHHDISFNIIKTLNQWITRVCLERGGKLIIPAFSVGRTQEVLYALNQLELEKRLPAVPYFVDSPLSLKATQAIKKHTEHFNDRLQQVLKIDDDPFQFTGLRYVESAEDSWKLIDFKEPCVIISASGTADGGRVRRHLEACLDNAANGVLLVGYCSAQSTGGLLASGVEEIDFHGEPCTVAAEIGQMSGMSAHGDCDDLCQFMSCQETEGVKGIFLVHGEYAVQQDFAGRLERKGFTNVQIPAQHEAFELSPQQKDPAPLFNP